MNTPFTTAEFLDVFARYNRAVWPAQLVLYLLAGLVLWLAWRRPGARGGRVVAGLLAVFWGWMAVAYHAAFFTAVNPAAWLFAALFGVEAILFADAAARSRPAFRPARTPAGIAGAALVAYALVVYPLIGQVAGPAYPRAPTFGLPCPTVIFTLGVLLWAERGSVPARLLPVPAAWSLLGAVAAYRHGIVQDYGLLVAGLVATPLVVWTRRQGRRAPALAGG